MVWVLVGVRSCVAAEVGHSLVTPFFLVWSVKDRSLHMTLGRSQTYYPKHILVYGAWKTCCSLVVDLALSGSIVRVVFELGGSCTALSPGLRGGGLESQFGRGPGHPGQESDGLVLLVPRVQAGRVFSGYLARGIDSRIAGLSGMACLRFSIVVRTER